MQQNNQCSNDRKWNIFICCTFSVGRTKIVSGAGLGIVTALTGNVQLQQAGVGLVGLGAASSIGAHLCGKKKWTEKNHEA